jgi:hypothetical protein
MHAEFQSQALKSKCCVVNLGVDGKIILIGEELSVAVAGFYERKREKFLNALFPVCLVSVSISLIQFRTTDLSLKDASEAWVYNIF